MRNALGNEHALFSQAVYALHESGRLEDATYHTYRNWIATVMAAHFVLDSLRLPMPVALHGLVSGVCTR